MPGTELMQAKTNVSVKITSRSLNKAIADFKFYQNGAQKAVKDAINTSAINVQRKAKENATQRPGPKVRSGVLRSSIHAKFAGEDDYTWKVFTNVEYAMRIEFGFRDTDSRGRKYNQRAYPFLHPAAESERRSHRRRIAAALKLGKVAGVK